MRERHSRSRDPAPWQVPVALEDIADTGQHFDLVASDEVRAVLARMTGLRDLPRLEASFDVTRHGAGGLHVVGRVHATVGQTCVVTLEPLANAVDEAIDLVFVPAPAAAPGGTDGETTTKDEPEARWDDPEPLIGGKIDLGALATEFLILGLDPYPRRAGVVFEPPAVAGPEAGPFAALAALKKGGDGR